MSFKAHDAPFNYLEVEAALIVWEWINDVTQLSMNADPGWAKIREDHGSAELRHQSIHLGQWCLRIYQICTAHDHDFFDMVSYDWEVIPMIMMFAMTNDHALPHPAIYDYELPDPFVTAHFVAYTYLYVLYLNSCRRAADKLWGYADLVKDHEDRVPPAFANDEDPEDFVRWLGEKYDLTPATSTRW